MKTAVVSFVVGAFFAAGLALSGMTRPEKVIGFLDFFGAWDPSLVVVMAAAIMVYAPVFWMTRRRGAPLLGGLLTLPSRRDIDGRLILGSALFGAGWGLAGYCPGPSLSSAGSGADDAVVVVAGLALGVVLLNAIEDWRGQPRGDRSATAGASSGTRSDTALAASATARTELRVSASTLEEAAR